MVKSAMLDLLELLMAKASSYSWSSVRSFHGHIAKQVELRRLEWTSLPEIREKATTYFKHSDLRPIQRAPCFSQTSHPQSTSALQRNLKPISHIANGTITAPVHATKPISNPSTLSTNAGCVPRITPCCIAQSEETQILLLIQHDYLHRFHRTAIFPFYRPRTGLMDYLWAQSTRLPGCQLSTNLLLLLSSGTFSRRKMIFLTPLALGYQLVLVLVDFFICIIVRALRLC